MSTKVITKPVLVLGSMKEKFKSVKYTFDIQFKQMKLDPLDLRSAARFEQVIFFFFFFFLLLIKNAKLT